MRFGAVVSASRRKLLEKVKGYEEQQQHGPEIWRQTINIWSIILVFLEELETIDRDDLFVWSNAE